MTQNPWQYWHYPGDYADGGPAFPLHVPAPVGVGGGASHAYPGMTLRDYFAGVAMASGEIRSTGAASPEESAKLVAEACYMVADAMLAARKRPAQNAPHEQT